MGLYRYSLFTRLKSFINDLGMMILHIISKAHGISSRDIYEELIEKEVYTSKSHLYRYLSTLKEYGLIRHEGWEKGVGYRYFIENKATRYLEFSRQDIIL